MVGGGRIKFQYEEVVKVEVEVVREVKCGEGGE